MRIESIKIKNFRQYEDVAFEFKKSKDNDIHIVLGKNGIGKTNILNAITWCLYGEELHLGDKDKATSIINNTYAQQLRTSGKNKGEVSVSIDMTAEEDKKSFVIKRVATYSVSSSNPIEIDNKFKILHTVNGEWVSAEDEESTKVMISRYIPKSINEYIFFDGEHLERYFQAGQTERIMEAINEFTQANMLEKTYRAFDNYHRTQLLPKYRESDDQTVIELEKENEKIDEQITSQNDTIKEMNEQVRLCRDTIAECNRIIDGNQNVPEKAKRLLQLDTELDNLRQSKKDKLKDFYKFIREYYVYLTAYPAMSTFYKYIKKQEREGKLPPKMDRDFLQEVLRDGNCPICDSPLKQHAIDNINALLDKLAVSTNTSAELNKTMTALSGYFELIRLYPKKKSDLMKDIQNIDDNIEQYEAEYQSLSDFLKTVPNNAEISKAIERKDDFEKKKEDFLKRVGEETATLNGLIERKEELQKQLDSAVEKNKKLTAIKKQCDYCKKCMEILMETKEEVLDECRTEMQDETFRQYCQLLWKKDTFVNVEIDKNYNFILHDSFGNQTLGSCSAAERVLLALSFTLALQKVSKHDSLLFIDTPLGRVDEENRSNMISTLLEISKFKQVILTFTPTEYDVNVKSMLAGNYSSFQELKMQSNNTSIRN